MRYKRVLLINSVYLGSHYSGRNLPVGLGYVSEALTNSGIKNTILDMVLGYSFPDIEKRIREFCPDLIGLGMMSFKYKQAYELINSIKGRFPNIDIVLGGPHISILRGQVFKDCSAVDFGVTLEGEKTIVELCGGGIPIEEIKGLLYRESSGCVSYSGDRAFMADLDVNNFPRYDSFEIDKYSGYRAIVTSRGCPYRCIYCPVKSTIGTAFRFRSVNSVVDEFEYWYRRGIRYFNIVDDNFTLNRERVFGICDEIEKKTLSGLSINCGNGVRADRVDRALLKRMRDVGFFSLAFGVEAGNNTVLRRLRKATQIESMERAISAACELGFRVTLFFLIGSPGETRADVEDSLRLATKYPVYDVRFYNLIPFPGTELYKWVKENGYFLCEDYLNDASHWINRPIFETPELNRELRRKLYKRVNRIADLHTLAVKRTFHTGSVAKQCEAVGIPAGISRTLSRVYWSTPFYYCFQKTGLVDRIKGVFAG